MTKIARNLTELIGHTPLLELTKIEQDMGCYGRTFKGSMDVRR